jgi:hypothetical protein
MLVGKAKKPYKSGTPEWLLALSENKRPACKILLRKNTLAFYSSFSVMAQTLGINIIKKFIVSDDQHK